MTDYQKFAVAMEAVQAALPSVPIHWEYDVDYCFYRILFEPLDSTVNKKLFLRVYYMDNNVKNKNPNNIASCILNDYQNFELYRIRIARKYAEHKIREKRRNNDEVYF